MKFVLTWTVRSAGTAGENIEGVQSTQKLLANWQPDASATMHQWLVRCDNNGGFAVLETDDPAALYKDIATWSPWISFQVFPVLDITESTPLQAEAVGIAKSAL